MKNVKLELAALVVLVLVVSAIFNIDEVFAPFVWANDFFVLVPYQIRWTALWFVCYFLFHSAVEYAAAEGQPYGVQLYSVLGNITRLLFQSCVLLGLLTTMLPWRTLEGDFRVAVVALTFTFVLFDLLASANKK